MTRSHARSLKGKRVVGKSPRNRGTVTTILGSLTCQGIEAIMTIEGATDTNVFCSFVEEILAPKLKPNDVVVLDNLGAHRVKKAKEIIESKGAKLLFLPPYHPELNPIEMAWSKLKSALRSAEARTIEALDSAIAAAANAITPNDAINWISHCGYQVI
jgi:transposase